MQRPRRTAEFYEEPGTASKLRSRQTSNANLQSNHKSPTPGKVQKYGTRQSRIARPTSLERGTNSLMPPSSAMRNRQTPQNLNTPLSFSKTTATRLLFTAEKQRTGAVGSSACGGAMHNDKKWVQEQMLRITEYLAESAAVGTIAGFNHDFFARSNALRQISIKQFVSIINYFLQFTAGNRFTVGTNHVEDIVNILQKLNYPYQINKSWLKTPNTQHSFGNVIVLFDFLMDFVPDTNGEEQFEFEEPHNMTLSSLNEEQLLAVPPDVVFQSHMFQNAKLGFALWDKQLDQDFRSLQQKDGDELILKRCGFNGTEALNMELKRMQVTLDELERQRPQIRKDDEEQCRQLEEEITHTNQHLAKYKDALATNRNHIMQLGRKQQDKMQEASRLAKEVGIMKNAVKKQVLNVKQRDKLIEEKAQLTHILQSETRTLSELEDRNHHQQVLLSRIKKQLTDQVEKFNALMRKITYSNFGCTTTSEETIIQLPQNPQAEDLQRCLSMLKKLGANSQKQIKCETKELQQLEQQLEEFQEINLKNEQQTNELKAHLTAAQNTMLNFEQEATKIRTHLKQKLQLLVQTAEEHATEILKYSAIISEKESEIERMKQENERTMSEAENNFNVYAEAREDYLNKNSAFLEEATIELQELKIIVNENSAKMQKAIEDLKT